jgi:hypothetical protein
MSSTKEAIYKKKSKRSKSKKVVMGISDPPFISRGGPDAHYYPPDVRNEIRDYLGGSSIKLQDRNGEGNGPFISEYQEQN